VAGGAGLLVAPSRRLPAHPPSDDTFQLTGSASHIDAIVWGNGGSAQPQANNTPLLDKPITGEIGGVQSIHHVSRRLEPCGPTVQA